MSGRRTGVAEPGLLSALERVQEQRWRVAPESISDLSRELRLPRGQVEGAATFYSFLSREPRGEYDILLSDCLSDRYHGQDERARQLCRGLDVTLGQTRGDGRVSVGLTSCSGLCDQVPSGLVNGRPLTRLTAGRIHRMVGLIEAHVPVAEWPDGLFAVTNNVRRTDLLLSGTLQPGDALRELIAIGPEEGLARIELSGLRGRGGAGFRTGLKWKLCREAPGEQVVVCNADEGEPGTFKDRVLLQSFAHPVIEGMTSCARIIGARLGLLYLRGEYRYLVDALEAVLAQRRARQLLGEHILDCPDFSFDVEVRVGAGAYVCGEESALIESLEGKRGIPRIRPPFPVTSGYEGQPTVVNNVETLAAATGILVHGADWFRSTGTEQSTGTKLLSVSGDCARPGVYEFPMGTRLQEVLDASGAIGPKAVQVSGPAGVCLAPPEFSRRIAYEDLPAGGAVMVIGPDRDLLDVVANHSRFFAHESCGFCTPCRLGTQLQCQLLANVQQGTASPKDLRNLEAIAQLMKKASHCGLGQSAGHAVLDTMGRFPELYTLGQGAR